MTSTRRTRILAAVAAAAVALTGFVPVSNAQAAVQHSFYVSPTGSNSNAGTTAASPWATLEKVRDHIREKQLNKGMTGDIVVHLRGGRHVRSAPFNLTDTDSGSNGFKVVYRAYPGESPIIDGGKAVSGWTRVSGAPYYVANVPESAGYADYFRQLYGSGKRAQVAISEGVAGSAFWDDPAIPNPPAHPDRPTRSYDGIEFPAGSVPAYTNVADVRLFHVAVGFKVDYFPVVGITTSGANKRVQLAQPHFQVRLNRDSGVSLSHNHTYHFLNAFEELDSPGEWYLNRATNKVYYYPRPGEDVNAAGAYVPVVESLVNVTGRSATAKARAITFDGVTFEHGNWLLPRDRFIGGTQAEALYAADPFKDPHYDGYGGEVPGQIKLTNTDGITFTNNTVRKMGNGGLQLLTGAENTTITGNVFYNLTAAGIIAGRWMDVHATSAARTKNIVISNNIVAGIGDDYFSATGISLMNTYNASITHNLVYDTAYTAFHQRKSDEFGLVDGVDGVGKTTFSHNEVHLATAKQSWNIYDNAAVYTFGAWPGTVISHNYVRNHTSSTNYYSDNQSFQTRWDYNVSEGGSFLWSNRHRTPLSVFASHSYTDKSNSDTRGVIFDGDGGPQVISGGAWPAEARSIMDGAGLQPSYEHLRSKVPTTNLANASTLSVNRSAWDLGLNKLYDETTLTGEARAPQSEAWAQFDLGADHEAFTFTIQQDGRDPGMITRWKVQRWSASQNAWIDFMPYQAINTTAPVVYKAPTQIATTNIRLYLQNAKVDGRVGVQEFTVTGVRR